jgi:peptidoglycan hydrolase CwlO-like protein|tara:strand:- start:415 stop:687 length:273 start_codon:yes stop_codon:yes gene_type:complete
MKDKRTYTELKDHGVDISYENEVKLEFDDRGSHDLTKQIDMLKKQKEFLQEKCRQAGQEIRELKRDNTLLSYDVATLTDRIKEMENNAKR